MIFRINQYMLAYRWDGKQKLPLKLHHLDGIDTIMVSIQDGEDGFSMIHNDYKLVALRKALAELRSSRMKELTPDEHKILVDAIQDSATVVHKGRKDMNERIRELMDEATVIRKTFHGIEHIEFDKEKFAELIIKQCAKSLWTEECHTSDLALEEFERNCAKIKEHFGVKE